MPESEPGDWANDQPEQAASRPAAPGQPPLDGPPSAPYGSSVGAYPPARTASAGEPYRRELILPPGTELCSIGRRIGAYLLEGVLAVVTLGIGYFVWDLCVWSRGQTPGKQLLGMYCYRPSTGLRASWGYMLLRWVGFLVEGILPFVGTIVSFVMVCASDERRAIHDHIADTVVLHELPR